MAFENKKIKGVIRGALYKKNKSNNSPLYYLFQFNPSEINESENVKYVSNDAPGITFPKSQYLGGGEHEITFTLFISSIPFTENIDDSNGITGDLEMLKAMKTPELNTSTPPLLYFSFGSITEYVTIRKLDKKIIEFSSSLVPLSGEITLTLRVEKIGNEASNIKIISDKIKDKKPQMIDLRFKMEEK